MTTDMVLHEPHSPASVQDLAVWADSARAAASIAVSLVKTSFVPAQFRGKPEEATAAILSGVELGLSPMAALRSFDIIQGAAAARAITLRAVVQSAGHELWTEESTPTRAVVCGQRRGSDHVERSVWTIDRARNLQLTGKDNWKKQPQAMLLARATSECARLVAADAILGIPYSIEELEDELPTPTTATSRAEPRPAQRRQVAAKPEPEEPPLDEPTPAAAPAEPEPSAPPSVTKAQLAKIHAQLNELNITDRELGLEFISETVERTLATSKDLTKDEASRVVDRLEQILRPEVPDEQADGSSEPEEPEL